MKGRNIITINGRAYDAITGMPLPQAAAHQLKHDVKSAGDIPGQPHRAFSDISIPRSVVASPAVHKQLQHSQTLHRAALQRPAAKPITHAVAPTALHRSPAISKFGPASVQSDAPNQVIVKRVTQNIPEQTTPAIHPAVAKALAHIDQKPTKPEPIQSSKELKELLIKERLAEVDINEKPKKERRNFFRRQPRLTTILTSTLAVLLLGGYLTFINLPNISMRVAATRAGVAANFPTYQPDGYSFQGPITYSPGEVAVNFKSNTNGEGFTIKQKSSNWDSQAVLDNLVNKETDSYLTYQEGGLTIYSYNNKAAWVNGGLLYTVEGNAHLNNDQILHIATSL